MKTKILFAVITAVASAGIVFAETQIVNPRVNGRVEALGVDEDRIAFSWNLTDDEQDTIQTEYRITVQNIWDSGWIKSGRSIEIPFEGKDLQSSTRYEWSVEVKNNRNETAQLQRQASFTTGILKSDDWKAKWITMNRTDKKPLPIFRKSFEIDPTRKIEHAVVHLCGLGHFELNLNGEKIGDHFIDPGWTNYRKTCLYVSFDLTDSLKSGENVFGVLLGNGMYNVPGGRYVKFTGSFGMPMMICRLHVKYADGGEQLVVSDETWKTALGPITFSCVYGGEDVDNRRIEPGWDKPDFMESENWTGAVVTDGLCHTIQVVKEDGTTEQSSIPARLAPQEAPPIKVAETKKPESLKRLSDGRYVADFGYNFSGRPRVVLKGKAGQSATVKTAEIVDRIWDGHSYTLTLGGDGEELLLPKFTYFGFQFLYVEGAVLESDRTDADADKPTLVSVEADFTTSSVAKVGTFECGDELLNEIDAMIDRSVRSNLASVLTDCPHREKLGWLEVAHLMGPSIMCRYDMHNLYRKICRDMTESQLDNGLVPDIAPEYTRFEHGFFESPEWGSAAVQIPWLLYKYYGDTDILRRQSAVMIRYVDYLASTRNEKGLVKAGLGDWYDWSGEKGHAGYSQHTPGELTATAVFIDNAGIMADMACVIGAYKSSTAKDWGEYRALVRTATADFLKSYRNSETEKIVPDSQSAIAETLAVILREQGMICRIDPELGWAYELLAQKQLVARIEADGYKPTVGEVSFPKLIRALVAGNRNDILWKMIHRTDKPGYGYMLRAYGMKTLSETWDGPGSSMNHCMFGHIQEWFTGTIVGINLTGTQLSSEKVPPNFVLNPTPVGDLTWAKGHYDSVYGRVESSWNIEDGKFRYRFSIPANTTATVCMPSGQRLQYGSGTHESTMDYEK